MAKTPVKKSRRRLKRSVRRSLAAVFMITAIGVAAIPVPENLAEAGVPASVNPAVQPYQPADKDSGAGEDCYEDFGKDTNNEKVKIENDKVEVDGGWAAIIKEPDSKYHSTEIVIEDNGNTYLTWQFVYEELTNTTGKLCGYNSTYHMDSVTLGLQPIERYYMVTADDFNAYYTSPGTIADETIKNDMENIQSNGNAVTGKVHPVNKIKYEYDDYEGVTDSVIGLSPAEKKFLEDYYPTQFQEYTKLFKDYYEKEQAGEEVGEKRSLEVSPADLDIGLKIKFFCENNAVLRDTGYSLKQAFDQRLDGKGDTVYLAHGGNPEMLGNNVTGKTYTDYNGYVASYDKHSIPVIGDNAFFGANNVGQIVISDQVRAIGNSAFELSGISSLTIGNAETIGNRAFARCHTLKEVQFSNPGTKIIGAEAFWDSGISSKLSLPYTITTIGYGAFAECLDLSEVEFDQANSSQDLVLKNYAFFNDKALTEVDFGKIGVKSMGYACFAVESPGNDAMTEFSFPTVKLGELKEKEITVGSVPLDSKTYKRSHTLANRRNLNTVNIPKGNIRIPDGTFYNCFGLEKVAFDADSADATFGPDLFADVTNPDFCVYGPETSNGMDPAGPRTSTWDATRNDGKSIPYVYESGGKTYYEVAIESKDGRRYRYGAGNDGELISCALIDEGSGLVDIVIPEKIGNFAIKRIGEDCFSDKELREAIRTITIQNNSISEIADGAFAELQKLTTVSIGNSVASIGDRAFYGCLNLKDVYFKKPSAGYESVTFGTDAFVTTGSELTFHGDIVKGYAPFEYAVNQNNILKSSESTNAPAINICYKSLWSSEAGAHLTVMADKNGTVTLLDYPKFDDLLNPNDKELGDFCREMEDYYYNSEYNRAEWDIKRTDYADLWQASQSRGKISEVQLSTGETVSSDQYKTALERADIYGPWINEGFCESWNDWRSETVKQKLSADSGITDLLFKPLAVYAAEGDPNPKPYFDAHPYNFMDNYDHYLNDPAYDSNYDYNKVPDQAWNYINAPQAIVVPDGVDSIDVFTYSNECRDNYDEYIRSNSEVDPKNNQMYTSVTKDATPGLFSGYYEDYEAPDEREEEKRGNDYIKSIVLTSVKTLPDYAFDSCEQLDSVELGAVEEVGDLPFRGCPNLIHLTGSERYPALNGILYEKNEGTPETYDIVECLMSRGRSDVGEETIARGAIGPDPDTLISSVVEIRDGAFADCGDISIVDLGTAEGLAIIPEDCFEGCTNLRQVILPRTVTQIKEGAFGDVTENNNKLDVTIPGREVDIADSAFQPKSGVTIYTYEDSAAYRYGKRYEKEGMVVNLLTAYRVMFYDYDGTLVGEPQVVDKTKSPYATEPPEAETLKEPNHRPGYTFSGWETTGGKTLTDEITEDMTIFVAQYTSDGTMVNGKYAIEFIDGIDGRQLSGRNANADDGKYYIEPGASFADMGWNLSDEFTIPVHDGYAFKAWSDGWTENTLINSDTHKTVIALYSAQPTSGNSTNTSRNSGNTSNNSGNNNNNNNNNNSSSNSSTSSSSTSTTSTTSGSGSTVGRYTVTVQNGSGSGTYEVGSTVVISANEPAAGMTFQKWTTESNGVTLASVSLPATTFTMPANNVTVTANFVAAATTASANSSGDGSGSNSGSGSTRVDITKPGISNKDLAAANVNGSTDNFVVKITETDEATRAVAAALTNKYGSLDNILYYAMDISLYDSTGTTKITDVSGLSVDITIPIPDALVAYGGNNMAGAVINGDQLENLNENFTTINGVPCIRFTATHFSPYTVYVDTGNLTEGMLDTTPKTGDPIHPKWFLSLGLACLSVILFMKKDKGPKVKTA